METRPAGNLSLVLCGNRRYKHNDIPSQKKLTVK
jgi:hypothetical protein